MNPISDKISTGTLGELLVQVRLLQLGVQAAPPIKDSGNDLIAVNGSQFRAVSVRTTTSGKYNKPDEARRYHVLAVVRLAGHDREVLLDQCEIYLVPHEQVGEASCDCSFLAQYRFSRQLVEQLFGRLPN